MQPDPITTWDEFIARRAARETDEDLAESIQPPPPKRSEAMESSLSTLLLEAIHAVGARRGRIFSLRKYRFQRLTAPWLRRGASAWRSADLQADTHESRTRCCGPYQS
jgi:hypothetical protein